MEVIVVLDTNAYSDWRRSGTWAGNLAMADRVVVPSGCSNSGKSVFAGFNETPRMNAGKWRALFGPLRKGIQGESAKVLPIGRSFGPNQSTLGGFKLLNVKDRER